MHTSIVADFDDFLMQGLFANSILVFGNLQVGQLPANTLLVMANKI